MQETSGALQPHIRGIGTSANGPGIEGQVAIYVDGVYYANASSGIMHLDDIARVEVLKGPQGTLFGRNTTGGLIQLVTKDPEQDVSGTAQIGYGNYQDTTGNLYVTGGVSEKLATDLSVYYERQGQGYGTDIHDGDQVDQLSYDYAFRNKWLLKADDATEIRLSADYEQRESSYLAYHPVPEGTWGAANALSFDIPPFGGPFNLAGPRGINMDFQPNGWVKSGGVGLNIKHDWGAAVFTSITAYRDALYRYDLDVDFTPVNGIDLSLVQGDRQFSQEFQLASNRASAIQWVTGLYYFYAKDQWDPLGTELGGPVSAPLPAIDVDSRDAEHTHSYAAYAQATTPLFEGTNLTTGARYTYETKAFGGNQTTAFPGTPIPAIVAPVITGAYPDHLHEDKPSFRVSIDHKFTADVMTYAAFNSSFKSGGYNNSVFSEKPYAPETLHSWEVGTKTEWLDRRLRLNGAIYYYDYTDIQVGYFVSGSEAFTNGAKAKIEGGDVDFEAIVLPGLTVRGGVDYMHDRFISFPDAPFAIPGVTCTNTTNAPLCEGDASGHELPYAPTTTFNVGAEYATTVKGGELVMNLAYFHSSGFFSSPDNTIAQPRYGLLNASIAWTHPDGRLTAQLFGRNLTNQLYALSIPETPEGDVRTLGAPRTYGVALSYRFGRIDDARR
jgi:iron complex outermembrane receptor protein